MVQPVRIQKRRKKRLYFVGALVVLLAAAGGILYRLPASLQDINRFFQLAVSKIYHQSADKMSAEPVLRGTIFDRNLREMAVSYRVFSLYAQPADIEDLDHVAEVLATIIGKKKAFILDKLKGDQRVVEITDDLDSGQATSIGNLEMAGLYCKASEARFYPAHTTAAHVLGFTDKNLGLAGVESKYDTILQPGEFRAGDVPQINTEEEKIFGSQSGDLILTLDLGLQKQVEEQLRDLLKRQGSRIGAAIVLDPSNGKIMAMASQPAFNPNYFWQAGGAARINNVCRHHLDFDLIKPLLVPVVAAAKYGVDEHSSLPETVASLSGGVTQQDIEQFASSIEARQKVDCDLPSWSVSDSAGEGAAEDGQETLLSPMQFAVTVAALINGGWRIRPFLFHSFHDRGTGQRLSLREDAVSMQHVFSPAMGVSIRRTILRDDEKKPSASYLFSGEVNRFKPAGVYSEHSIQKLVFGLVPRKAPKFLFLMVTESETLYPHAKGSTPGMAAMETVGRKMIALLQSVAPTEEKLTVPAKCNEGNFQQFLVSRRVESPEQTPAAQEVSRFMPDVTGLSLRKGLQRLSQYDIQVQIKGSGRIVAQDPDPGKSLSGVKECVLTLE